MSVGMAAVRRGELSRLLRWSSPSSLPSLSASSSAATAVVLRRSLGTSKRVLVATPGARSNYRYIRSDDSTRPTPSSEHSLRGDGVFEHREGALGLPGTRFKSSVTSETVEGGTEAGHRDNEGLLGPVPAHMQRPSTSTNKKTAGTSSATSAFSARCTGAAPNMTAAPAGAAAEKPDSEIEFNPKGFPPESALHTELQEAIQAAAAAGANKILKNDAMVSAGEGDRIPDFNDAAASYAAFSMTELVRAYAVLRACAIRPLVENSEALLKIGYRTIGETLTNRMLAKTFFAHFCAGETAQEVGSRAGALKSLGIGGILDYAAEVDLRPTAERAAREAAKREAGDDRLLLEEPAQCRTYDYMGEEACDARTLTFLACIQAVRDQTPGGFAAVKLSALGDPVLLSQLTTCVHLLRGLFEDFDHDRDGTVSHEEFEAGYRRWFLSETAEERATLLRIMRQLDPDNTGGIDYVEWSNGMRLGNLGEITANCRNRGPMSEAALKKEGVALKNALVGRIQTLARAAAESGVRLMIDAEQSWLQPAIDNTVYGLQREFNREFPTIYTTCQCYLKDSLERLSTDLERAQRGGYVWAGKLVRGAYMVSERERSRVEGRESPVFETIEETHACYNAAISMVLRHVARGNRAEVMIATHNQTSIEHAISLMETLGIRRDSGVSFGQLLGMADNITFPLGSCGYKAYKYIPYGKVGETIPYLLRRAHENSGMLGGASHERGLLLKEMRRRVSSALSRSSGASAGRRGFSSSARDRLSFSSKVSSSTSSPNSKTRSSFSWAAGLLAWALASSIKRNDGDSGYRVADSVGDRLVGGGTEQNDSRPKLRRYEHVKRNERC